MVGEAVAFNELCVPVSCKELETLEIGYLGTTVLEGTKE
jgi:hypothetical protein